MMMQLRTPSGRPSRIEGRPSEVVPPVVQKHAGTTVGPG